MNKVNSMAASHCKKTASDDKIFMVNKAAQDAAREYGSEKVVNASVGALLHDDGRLAVLPTVVDILRNLKPEDYAAYAPIAGTPEFLAAAEKSAFRDCRPDAYIESVATPGGSGAIRHTIWNYSEMGDTILVPDWYWGPYKTVADENRRKIDTFQLFDDDLKFNISSFKSKVQQLVQKQKRLVILLNSPANNPTGFSLSDDEWDMVLDVLKEQAKDKENKLIAFLDIAYIDYVFDTEKSRQFFKKFSGLPENILGITGFSMSKGYTMYGMRCGAMICISSSEEIAKEFKNVNVFSNRGVWSNGTRAAMVLLDKIMTDEDLYKKVESERNELKSLLKERTKIFIEESQRVGLTICPYNSGFFIAIPVENSDKVVEKLKEHNIFAVPIPKGIRFAVCSVPKEKCAMVPEKILNAINSVK